MATTKRNETDDPYMDDPYMDDPSRTLKQQAGGGCCTVLIAGRRSRLNSNARPILSLLQERAEQALTSQGASPNPAHRLPVLPVCGLPQTIPRMASVGLVAARGLKILPFP